MQSVCIKRSTGHVYTTIVLWLKHSYTIIAAVVQQCFSQTRMQTWKTKKLKHTHKSTIYEYQFHLLPPKSNHLIAQCSSSPSLFKKADKHGTCFFCCCYYYNGCCFLFLFLFFLVPFLCGGTINSKRIPFLLPWNESATPIRN